MKMSLTQLKGYLASLLNKNLIANLTFDETHDNIVGLLDKIGKIVVLDQEYVDLLPELEGDFLPRGKTIEEAHEDLIMPEDFDRAGTGALTYREPSYRPVSYSYKIKRQKVPMSIPNDEIEQAVNTAEELASLVAMKHKRLTDSKDVIKFGLKKQLLGRYAELAIDEMSDSNPEFNPATDYAVNSLVIDDEDAQTKRHGIFVKPYDASEVEDISDWDDAVDQGFIIELHLVETLAKPVDTETGEAFIESAKALAERLGENGEGDSLNGNVLGVQKTLQMYIRHGIIPNLEVQTQAGAFQLGKLALPMPIKALRDFGDLDPKYYAIVVDTRGVKLHPNYGPVVRENMNADGDFLNLFLHFGVTPFGSRNTAIHVYKEPDQVQAKKVVKATKKESK